MELFAYYRLSERNAVRHVLFAERMGLLPLYVSLALMIARRDPPGPGLWSAMGITLGFELILWGAHRICFERNLRSRTATYLALTADAWFPLFLFAIQNALLLTMAGLIWITLLDLGFPATFWQHANLLLLLAMIPGCRIVQEIARVTAAPRWLAGVEACRYTAITLVGTWLAGTITLFLAPPGAPLPSQFYVIALILWVSAAIVGLTCAMLFVDHLLRGRATPR